MTSRNKTGRRIMIATPLAFALVVLTLAVVWRSGVLVTGPIAFSKQTWRLASSVRRHHMADDFLQSHFRPGMALEDLLDLLGEPRWDHEHWIYFLSDRGAGPGVGTPIELAQYPHLAVRFVAGEVTAVFGEAWLVEFGATQQPEALAFDADEWRSGDPGTRRSMAWTIETSPPFIGHSHAQILELLGEPDVRRDRTIEYELSWGLVDAYGLVFTVDDENMMTTGNVIQH